jgi:hypothetical protein
MSGTAAVSTDPSVFPNVVTGSHEPRPPEPVDRLTRKVRSVGAHVARLTCPAHGLVVGRGAVVAKTTQGLVPEPVPKAFQIEGLPLGVLSQVMRDGGAVFARPLSAGVVGADEAMPPTKPLEAGEPAGEPAPRAIPCFAVGVSFSM